MQNSEFAFGHPDSKLGRGFGGFSGFCGSLLAPPTLLYRSKQQLFFPCAKRVLDTWSTVKIRCIRVIRVPPLNLDARMQTLNSEF